MKSGLPAGPAEQAEDRLAKQERRRRRREGAIIAAAGLAVLFFALWEIRRPGAHGAGGNVFSVLLVNLNIVLVLLLGFLVVRNVMKLVVERRRGVLGSKLKSRMVLAFLAIAVFPAVLMVLVSLEFMTNTIDSWFNTKVEESLRGAWQLAQTYYQRSAEQALVHANALSGAISGFGQDLSAGPGEELTAVVRRYQQTYKLGTVQVFDSKGRQLLALFNEKAPTGIPLRPDEDLLVETLSGKQATRVESLGRSDIIRGSAPIRASDGKTIEGVVVVDYLVKRSARLWSEEILASFREYRQMKQRKQPFKNLYALTMALASLVVLFAAAWLGMYLARGITEPIGRLAEATRQVAEGSWDVELAEVGDDEISTLVRAFNAMTADLKMSHEALDERRRYTENVLANIDAGVVSVDRAGAVTTVNPAAVSLLGLRLGDCVGVKARELFSAAGYPTVLALLDELEEGTIASGTRRNVTREEKGQTLLVTATTLVRASGEKTGFVLFFEDVSQLAEIQRMEVWREVARRLAHEIKNPLTPIQLSTQRLRRRLRDHLSGEEADVFDECTAAIVQEVDELKNLVKEFSRFARHSAARKDLQDLNKLVEETLPLFRQARPDLCIDFESAPRLPAVLMNRDAVKRALVNLLDNAVAALAEASNGKAARACEQGKAWLPRIVVRTSLDPMLSRVFLEVADTGLGIPPEHRARVFEPYFSTKKEGTGLGLAIVASIAADHHAYVRLHENQPQGSRIVIDFPAAPARETT